MTSQSEGGKYKSYLKGVNDLISPVDVKKILVMDIGSNYIRVGLSGENFPLLNLPALVAKSKNVNTNDLTQTKLPDLFATKAISDSAFRQSDYDLYYPLVSSFEDTRVQNSEILKNDYFNHISAEKENAQLNNFLNSKDKEKNKSFVDNLDLSQNPKNSKISSNPNINASQNASEPKFTKDEAAFINSESLSDMENYFKFIFEDIMQLETSNIELLVLDSISMPSDFRVKLSEIFFENLRLQSINFMNTAVSSLFASGRTYGIAVEMGHGSTNIVPIYGGLVLKHAQHVSNYGGKDVTKFINSYLLNNNLDLNQRRMEKVSIIETIKEKIVNCSLDFEKTIENPNPLEIEESHFELPDGTIVQFDKQTKFGAAELLLRPGDGFWTGFGSLKKGELSIIDKIYDSLERCEFDMKRKLSQNILVFGGSSQTNNILNRLKRDYVHNMPASLQGFEHEIVQESNVPFSAWIGGSILGSIATFQNLKIKKSEFDEAGDLKHNFLFKRTFS
jgi:actin-related protein